MFSIYSASFLEKPNSTIYKHKVEIANLDDLRRIVCHDYVPARYRNFHRSNEDFVESDCIAMDINNDHAEDPSGWVTPESIGNIFPNVEYYVHFSRHHMKQKGGKGRKSRTGYSR